MAALISFLAGESTAIQDLGGSGLGFYGNSYGASVQVAAYQDTTYITNAAGNATDAIKVDNIKWVHAASGQIAGGEIRALQGIPNNLATLNIRFTNDTAVKVQNAQTRIFDRTNIDNSPVGVVAKVAALVHTSLSATPIGSGSTAWATLGGSGAVLNWGDFPAATSPGSGGFSPNGSSTVDTQHDFFVGISVMPTSIGSKNFALYHSLEYL